MKDVLLFGLGIVAVMLLGALVHQNYYRVHRPQITTEYQAVLLINGEVLYGRIAHLGSDHPVLRDPFTIDSSSDAPSQPSQPKINRFRDGPHGADHVVFPVTAIVRVEPVQADSSIGRLIAQRGLRRP